MNMNDDLWVKKWMIVKPDIIWVEWKWWVNSNK